MVALKGHIETSTEVMNTSSLQELLERLDATMNRYELLANEYETRLGELLRKTEGGDQSGISLEDLQKLQGNASEKPKKGGKNKRGKKGKSKKGGVDPDWITYRDIMIFKGNTVNGETELYFEALGSIKEKIEKLKRVREATGELGSSGLGSGITYLIYLREDIPERIVLRREEKQIQKFRFEGKVLLR